MHQEEKSERSRTQILNAALKLFSHRGYGATSVQDIAEEAGVSKGNVYHHFRDKEAVFRALLDRYFEVMAQPDFPFNRVLASGEFPENLEELGYATRDAVRQYKDYVALIYVDVVEFDGAHVRRFYEQMAARFEAFLEAHKMVEPLKERIADGLSPLSAVILATRIFFNYFSVEVLFGVKDHFGKGTDDVVREIATILRHGMLKNGAKIPAKAKKAAASRPRSSS